MIAIEVTILPVGVEDDPDAEGSVDVVTLDENKTGWIECSCCGAHITLRVTEDK